MSPEIVLKQKYRECVDVWSIGVLIYEMICGTSPFNADFIDGILDNIKNIRYSFPDHVSFEARDLLSKIFVLDKNNRFSLSDIMNHSWTNS